jgi:hypothetical protein
MMVHVLVAASVYDHGVVGVYSTEKLARVAAAAIWPQTDGRHRFRIVLRDLDRTYEGVFPYTKWPVAQVPVPPREGLRHTGDLRAPEIEVERS